MFATWCTATCRQRINANGFNAMLFILLKQKTLYQKQFGNHNYINYVIFLSCEKLLTLFVLILLHHVRLAQSSSSLPMSPLFSLSTDCLSFPPPGGPGPPSLPSPKLTPFPSGRRQQPALMSGTQKSSWKVTVYSDFHIHIFFIIFQNIK
jgi:hypothetical protein